jgi:hypothetical protein
MKTLGAPDSVHLGSSPTAAAGSRGPTGQPREDKGGAPATSLPVVPPAPTDSSPQCELDKLEKGSGDRRYPPRRATSTSGGAAWRPYRRSWPRQA